MSRVKFLMVLALATCAVTAVASSSALAFRFVERPCEARAIRLQGRLWLNRGECENFEPATETGTWQHKTALIIIEGTSGVSKLKGEILGAEALVTCNKDTFTGELEEGGASKGKVIFEECKVGNSKETFVNCEVPNIEFNFKDQLVGSAKPYEDEFKPASGELFVEIKIKNKGEKSCLQKGTFPVKGTQTCKLPGQETFSKEHEIKCETSGSKLEFNGKKGATYEGTDKVKSTSGVEWAVE
jgi:hypothetical protein